MRDSVQQVGQRGDQRDRRLPREDPARAAVDARRLRPAHAAEVEVEHAAEVLGRVVVGQPPAQVAVEDDGVEQRLERVVGVAHRLVEDGGAVLPGGRRGGPVAEPVGLVVDRQEAGAAVDRDPDHHVDRAGEVAEQALAGEVGVGRQGVGEGEQRVAAGRCARSSGPRSPSDDVGGAARPARSPPAQRHLEVELAQPVGEVDVAQRQPARERPERASRTPRRARRRAPRRRPRPPTRRGAPRSGRAARRAGRARRGRRARAPRAPASRTRRPPAGRPSATRRPPARGRPRGPATSSGERLELGVVEVGRVVGLGQDPVGSAGVRSARPAESAE